MQQLQVSNAIVFFFVVCWLCAGSLDVAHAQVADQDRAALIALFQATTADEPWFHEYGFSQAVDSDPDNDVPIENWQTNDPIEIENGRVVYVNLYGNNLNGTLPDEICNMDALRELDLGVNNLSGPIPACIGNMAALTKLDIAGFGNLGNKMSGTLPESLGELENLEVLDLRFNQLTGSIPSSLGDLVNLKELHLNNNQLEGAIPSSLGALANLQTLRLFSNQLTGSLPVSLGELSNLQELHLSNNQLNGPIPASLGDLGKVQVIDLHVNQLSGTIPATLGNLNLLTKLDLGGNQLSGTVPADLGNMSSLQDLSLAGNALTDFEPGAYAGWSGLRFQVSSNQLTNIPSLNGPTAAYVSSNKLSFADLEPVAQLGLEENNFFYANQQPTIDVRQTIEDGVVVLSVEDGMATMYQWQQLDAEAGRYVSIDGATETSFTPTEPGTYRCRLTNPLLPNLTLLSESAMIDGAVIVVNSTGDAQDTDVNDGTCDTGDTVTGSDGQEVAECTLRAAMQMANLPGNEGPLLIAFDIPGSGVPTIAPNEALPEIEQPLTMDGTTQSAGSVLLQGTASRNGLIVQTSGSGSRIAGLIMSGFGVAIGLVDAGETMVEKNTIVGNWTGLSIEGIIASAGNVVRDNVIGSNQQGLFLAGAAHDNTIVDNYIGTERDGFSPLENVIGVWIAQGGSEKPRGNILRNNVISANVKQGVLIQGGGAGNLIESNNIGVDQTGTQVLPNGQEGIHLEKASGIAIRSNVIAGNQGAGVRWQDTGHIELIGNYIGTNADGLTGLGNEGAGLLGFTSVQTVIRDNVIASNFDSGIRLSTTNTCEIQHNWIGTDPLGRVLGNGAHGVLLEEAACTVGYDNTIAHNQESGIFLRDVERRVLISRNTVVANLTGLTVLRGARSIISFNTFNANHRHVDVIEAEDLVFWYNELMGGLGASTGIHLTASSATIEGNLITDDAGDAITLEGGSTATVTGNNIFGNAGMGLNNLTPAVMVSATGNWWGDASGPGGQGPGTGDQISAGVDVSGWLDEMVAVVAAAEADEILLPSGQADTVSVFFQNWQHRTDALDLAITDTEGWLQSAAALTISLNEVNGAVAPLAFAVPASTPNGTTSTVEVTATSQADASHTATTTFTLIAESAVLAQVLVAPGAVEVAPGDTVLFDAFGLDQFNRTVEIMPTWSATGGDIDENGLYVAGSATGEFTVTATDPATGLVGTARVGNGVSVAVEEDAEVPEAFHLAPNYPNPFNPETTIAFTVPQQAQVRLVVYDMLGREIAVLVDGVHPAGTHTVRFDASTLPSGVYLYRMQAGSYGETRPMVLLR